MTVYHNQYSIDYNTISSMKTFLMKALKCITLGSSEHHMYIPYSTVYTIANMQVVSLMLYHNVDANLTSQASPGPLNEPNANPAHCVRGGWLTRQHRNREGVVKYKYS